MEMNFILGGVPRSGTTSLYEYLYKNPKCYIGNKESWFLFLYRFSKNYIKDPLDFWNIDNIKTWLPEDFQLHNNLVKKRKKGKTDFDLIYNKAEYIEKYIHAPQGVIKGDCSPIYLATYKDTIPNILECIDEPYDIKFIFILRNPIEACISYFKMFVRLGWEKRTFEEAIEWELKGNAPNGFPYLSTFLYFDAIKAYKDTFGKNVRIFYFEEINNKDFLEEVCDFLEIEKHSDIFPHENKSTDYAINKKLDILLGNKKIPNKLKEYLKDKNIRKGDLQLSTETMQILNAFFKDDIKKLYELLGNKNILNWQNINQESL